MINILGELMNNTEKELTIKFRANVDTEEVREAIEDNLGVEILEIEEN